MIVKDGKKVIYIYKNGNSIDKVVKNNEVVFGIPEGYTKVEYIQGNDSGYIPTDIYLTGADTVKIKYQRTGGTAHNVFGCFTTAEASDNFSLYVLITSTAYIRYGNQLIREYRSTLNTINDIEMSSTGFKVDGETIATWQPQTFTASVPLYLGYVYGVTSPKFIGRIYEVEIVGKARLYPCVRNSDNKAGFYDIINGVFYEADGTVETNLTNA